MLGVTASRNLKRPHIAAKFTWYGSNASGHVARFLSPSNAKTQHYNKKHPGTLTPLLRTSKRSFYFSDGYETIYRPFVTHSAVVAGAEF